MKKSDLKYGNVVETRTGDRYLLVSSCGHIIYVDLNKCECNYFGIEIFNSNYVFQPLNIMKVYADYTCKELIWERKEPKEKPKLTEDEKVILRNIDKEYKWIARDDDGLLCVYKEKPTKDDYDGWNDSAFSFASLWAFDNLFQFIKWEDDEPYSIEELLKGK